MEDVATIRFRDLDANEEAVAVVRASPTVVGLALSRLDDGDIEVFMPPETCDELIAALSQARRVGDLS